MSGQFPIVEEGTVIRAPVRRIRALSASGLTLSMASAFAAEAHEFASIISCQRESPPVPTGIGTGRCKCDREISKNKRACKGCAESANQ